MKFLFDYDNIETDDYHHPLDPDDSTHSKLLTVYCPLDKSTEEIKEYFEDIQSKAKNWDESYVQLSKEIIDENKQYKSIIDNISKANDILDVDKILDESGILDKSEIPRND